VLEQPRLPVLTGNEAMGLGMINAGLNAYVAYPMTPSSNLLHYLAGNADEYGLTVMHPESEIAVILMALGFSYAGKKAAVGTSGGGFCLMTESLSLAGMAEIPVVVVLGQRPGPSTGVPTHTAQEDLQFALSAGQGEFVRLVVAPGDAEQAFTLAALALNTAWKYQIPAIVISDTALSEGTYTFERTALPPVLPAEPLLWNGEGEYARYRITENGVSPMTFPSDKRAVVKVSSYEHDEQGLTTDRAPAIAAMYAKRLRKEAALRQELTSIEQVVVSGNTAASIALVCWGSNKGVCDEVARRLELRAVQTLVMAPFPVEKYRAALEGVTCCIVVESNATGQFARLSEQHGFRVDEHVLKYDGQPFSVEELKAGVRDVLAARIPISAGT
jgi:2-oxoglutarate ferredoxin oxidoreductase subunit alpha